MERNNVRVRYYQGILEDSDVDYVNILIKEGLNVENVSTCFNRWNNNYETYFTMKESNAPKHIGEGKVFPVRYSGDILDDRDIGYLNSLIREGWRVKRISTFCEADDLYVTYSSGDCKQTFFLLER